MSKWIKLKGRERGKEEERKEKGAKDVGLIKQMGFFMNKH